MWAGGVGPRTFIGWDAELEMPSEVMRAARAPRCQDSSSESSDSDGDGGGDNGVDCRQHERRRRRGPVCVEWAGVAELESEKLEAIHSAIEVACSVMGVDQIIVDPR